MRAAISSIVVLLLTATSARADTVVCTDGTKSTAGRGACSHHGGVASEERPAPNAGAEKPERTDASDTPTKTRATAPTAANVRCEDGTTSTAGRGACSHHGGVANGTSTTTRPAPKSNDTTTKPAPKSNDTTTMAPDSTGVTCVDGTTSTAGRGACSHHGGVANGTSTTTKPAPKSNDTTTKPAPRSPDVTTTPPASQSTSVTCVDGTTSTAGRGACSHHSGVAKDAMPTRKPAPTQPPKSASVRCEDGTTSVAGRGACSHHGGVWDESKARADRRADTEQTEPTDQRPTERATARCNDGTYSYSAHHRGSCSHHGGVEQWFTN